MTWISSVTTCCTEWRQKHTWTVRKIPNDRRTPVLLFSSPLEFISTSPMGQWQQKWPGILLLWFCIPLHAPHISILQFPFGSCLQRAIWGINICPLNKWYWYTNNSLSSQKLLISFTLSACWAFLIAKLWSAYDSLICIQVNRIGNIEDNALQVLSSHHCWWCPTFTGFINNFIGNNFINA